MVAYDEYNTLPAKVRNAITLNQFMNQQKDKKKSKQERKPKKHEKPGIENILNQMMQSFMQSQQQSLTFIGQMWQNKNNVRIHVDMRKLRKERKIKVIIE